MSRKVCMFVVSEGTEYSPCCRWFVKFLKSPFPGRSLQQAEPGRVFYFSMMTLKDGKFYKDGQPYPIEFGNKDQIALMAKCEEARKHGIQAELFINEDGKTFSSAIGCVCGFKTEIGEWITGSVRKCKGCKLRYAIFEDDDFGFTYVKIV